MSAIAYAISLASLAIVVAIAFGARDVSASLRDVRDALRELKAVLKGEDEDDIPFVLEEIAAGIRDIAEWHRPDDARPPRPSEEKIVEARGESQ